MSEDDRSDRDRYAPFVLMDRGGYRALRLAEPGMEAKTHLFAERSGEGWCGNGYDRASLAQALVAERLPQLQGRLSFDPQAGMRAVGGARADLETLGAALLALYRDDADLRDLLARAGLD